MSQCQHCSRELQSANFGQHDKLTLLIEWLCDITCIPWRAAWSTDVTPDCEQYGVIEIMQLELIDFPTKERVSYQHVSAVDVDGDPLTRQCLVLDFTEMVTLSLRVYRDTGRDQLCDDPEDSGIPAAPIRSNIDVLRHVLLMTFVESELAKLRDIGVSVKRGNAAVYSIRDEDEAGRFCGTHAEMDLMLNICQRASYPLTGELFHYCVFTCEGKPLCLPKPTC